MLVAHLTERQAKLVIIDHKRIEYNSYDKQASHLLTPILTNPLQGVAFLSSLVNGSMDAVIGSRSVFIHIEECDMYAAHPEAFNYIVRAIARSDNLHLVYSTSRPAQEHVAQWLVDFGDAIVFSNPPHERILVTKYGNRALPRLSEECSEYLMNDFTLTLKE